jgi:predicted phage baseplate assembly protein
LEEAQGRLLAGLATQARAVTLADYEAIALQTPGVPVARARAIADYHPALPCFPAAGNVTIVVVPACPDLQPEPSEDFLGAIHRYLDRRRTLATELHVIGPCYLPVRVSACLHASAQSSLSTASLVSQAEGALDAFFHPLTGGPDGAGWPVGRDIYQSEILALLSAIPGVDYVDELGFLTGPAPNEQAGGTLCSNVTVCPDCLVQPGPHQIRIVRRIAR